MKIPNNSIPLSPGFISLARIVSEDSQRKMVNELKDIKSSKDS